MELQLLPANSRLLALFLLILTFNLVIIPTNAGLLLPVLTPSMENDTAQWSDQLLLCIYSVRQCLPACLNGGRLWRPSMPWKKCHCKCPEGFRGFVCQIPLPPP